MLKILGISLFVLSGGITAANAAATDCKAHMTDSGGLFSGFTSKTWEDFPGVVPTEAYRRAYVYVVKQGWKLTSADKDIGMIGASLNNVVSLEGIEHPQPVNVLVEPDGGGSKVTVTFFSGVGIVGSGGDAIVCNVLASEYSQ